MHLFFLTRSKFYNVFIGHNSGCRYCGSHFTVTCNLHSSIIAGRSGHLITVVPHLTRSCWRNLGRIFHLFKFSGFAQKLQDLVSIVKRKQLLPQLFLEVFAQTVPNQDFAFPLLHHFLVDEVLEILS